MMERMEETNEDDDPVDGEEKTNRHENRCLWRLLIILLLLFHSFLHSFLSLSFSRDHREEQHNTSNFRTRSPFIPVSFCSKREAPEWIKKGEKETVREREREMIGWRQVGVCSLQLHDTTKKERIEWDQIPQVLFLSTSSLSCLTSLISYLNLTRIKWKREREREWKRERERESIIWHFIRKRMIRKKLKDLKNEKTYFWHKVVKEVDMSWDGRRVDLDDERFGRKMSTGWDNDWNKEERERVDWNG